MVKAEDEDLISTYFCIKKRIEKAEQRIQQYNREFMNNNFYTCTQIRYEEMTTVAFNLEKEVINHLAAIEKAERHIKLLQFKYKHFNRFWDELPNSDKEYYLNRYKHENELLNDKLDRLITEEVNEIEEAASYRFGGAKLTSMLIEQSDPNENLNQMLELLGV